MKLNYSVLHVQQIDQVKEIVVDGQTGIFQTKKVVIEMEPNGHDGSVVQLIVDLDTTEFIEGTVCSVTFDNPPPVLVAPASDTAAASPAPADAAAPVEGA